MRDDYRLSGALGGTGGTGVDGATTPGVAVVGRAVSSRITPEMSGSGVIGPVRTLIDGIGITTDGNGVGVPFGVGVGVARTIGLLKTMPK